MAAGVPSSRDIVAFLKRYAALMELAEQNPFRVRAIARAARRLEELGVDIPPMSSAGTLTEIDGVGKGVADLVAEFIASGTARAYDDLAQTTPESLLELLRIGGLGSRKVRALHDGLAVATLDELEQACRLGQVADLPGFGTRTEQTILEGIAHLRRQQGRYRLDRALAVADHLLEILEALPQARRVSLAGSLRRRRELVKDIDIVVSTADPGTVATAFTGLPQVARVVSRGERKVTVRLREEELQADLRLVDEPHFATMLHHFTGSRDHNIALRARAQERRLRLNEYGLFRGHGSGQRLDTPDEADLFAALGLDEIPPELREDLGEIEAAEAGCLPPLLQAGDLRGVLHVHTTASDGRDSLETMVHAAARRGAEYICICDHSQSAAYARGMKRNRVRRQWEEIDALQDRGVPIRILKGIEADIRRDGSLDYDDALLEGFDLVVAALHSPMGMDQAALTARIVRAIEHPSTSILAHPTGRLLLEREAYPLDLDTVIAAAAARGVALEFNTQPARLDLEWPWLRRARDAGVAIALGADAHGAADLDRIDLGVAVARKAWIRPQDVVNAKSVPELLAWARGCTS